MKGFSTVTAFQLMDVKRFNYLDWESLFLFLRQNAKGTRKPLQPTKGKINAIFRRLDLNADTKLAFNEFAEAIKPVDVYFTEMHNQFKKEMDIGEAKKLTQMQMQQLKKELQQDYTEERSAQKAKPLRSFKTMMATKDAALKDELRSPVKKLEVMKIESPMTSQISNNVTPLRK